MLYFSPTKQVPSEIPKVEQDSKFYKDWSQVEKLKYKFAAIFLVLNFWSGGGELGATAFYVKSIPC